MSATAYAEITREGGETPLPRCNCANCRAWAAAPVPASVTVEEAARRREAYEAGRRLHLTNNPPLTRDDITLAEGG